MIRACLDDAEAMPPEARDELIPPHWTATPRPHPKSTRLSRFRNDVTTSATDDTPLARTILQARCEVQSDQFPCPIDAKISSDSSAFVIIAQGGWKHRDPVLGIHVLDEGTGQRTRSVYSGRDANADGEEGESTYVHQHYRSMALEPGLAEVAYSLALDTEHKLAVIADSNRIKTFYWGRAGEVTFGDWQPARGKNVHTLASKWPYDGPLAVLPGGRIARAGKGGIALWDMASLPTHTGGKRVGRGKVSLEDVWRDHDNDEIERSPGSAPSNTIRFPQEDREFLPAVWQRHEPSGHMLAGENARKTEGRYGCYALDLEAGGKKVTRFLGHGGHVEAFALSDGDANTFVTGCSDGYARMYDVRHPLPVTTLDAGNSDEFCSAVQFAHPDGVPGACHRSFSSPVQRS